ncbi:MAG TPA: SMC family ATPase [Acidimicrobiia bacterium]
MRPLSLSIEGFSAYRKRVDVDFTDVDYFSLSGPTGSGKSSLIDAMVFALYGRIPRLGGTTVAPAISTGRDQATVSFDFAVDDQTYTVIRDLHRTKSGGASVREARLERGAQSIESGANNVTRAVEELLRLSFDDFTRTVMLPQGEFARFLGATPSERQQLLRGLMGLDIYGEVGSRARSRESVAKTVVQEGRARLGSLELPTEESMLMAVERLEAIEQLAIVVSEAEESILGNEALTVSLQINVERLSDARDRLREMRAPDRLDEIGQLLVNAAESVEVLEGSHHKLAGEDVLIATRISGLPSMESVSRAETIQTRLIAVSDELSKTSISRLDLELKEAENNVAVVVAQVDLARASLETSRISHAAHDISSKLAVGDVCPVCDRLVETTLSVGEPGDIEAARKTVDVAESELDVGRSLVSGLTEQLGVERSRVLALEEKRDQLADDVPPDIDLGSLPAIKAQLVALIEQRSAIGDRISDVDSALKDAQRKLEDLAEQQRSLGLRLMAQREAIADLKPVPSESDDPIVQWKELIAWRDVELANTEVALLEMTRQLAEATDALRAEKKTVEASLEALDIAADGNYAVAVARAMEQARHRVLADAKLVEDAKVLMARIEAAEREAAVARTLSLYLRADGFERWLMVGAIADLVGGANELLARLSGSGYSLVADDGGSFDVIDHRNANESRPISTLSGGETFLVSLALALSLAETLSAAGGAGLDAIILDEGFGTLDDELLEVVAGVLEDLSDRGLMVGIITHVKELAGLAPVRFTVSKEPDGARVERLS